jgi:hypothetical protein
VTCHLRVETAPSKGNSLSADAVQAGLQSIITGRRLHAPEKQACSSDSVSLLHHFWTAGTSCLQSLTAPRYVTVTCSIAKDVQASKVQGDIVG